jgi:ATP-dependent exoDNAse (exonuclease V) alpha subunit
MYKVHFESRDLLLDFIHYITVRASPLQTARLFILHDWLMSIRPIQVWLTDKVSDEDLSAILTELWPLAQRGIENAERQNTQLFLMYSTPQHWLGEFQPDAWVTSAQQENAFVILDPTDWDTLFAALERQISQPIEDSDLSE